jgi:hypothetical protein
MGTAHNSCHETGNWNRFGPLQIFQLELQILRPKLPDENLFPRDMSCNHPFTQIWWKGIGSCHNTLGIIRGHTGSIRKGCGRRYGFLHIEEPVLAVLLVANADQHCVAQTSKGTAAFHPVSCIEQTDSLFVLAPDYTPYEVLKTLPLYQFLKFATLVFW